MEKPYTYQYWTGDSEGRGRTWLYDKRRVMESLIAKPSDCYLVSLGKAGAIITKRIAADEAARSLSRLVEALARRNAHTSIFDLDDDWSLWVRGLSAQTAR